MDEQNKQSQYDQSWMEPDIRPIPQQDEIKDIQPIPEKLSSEEEIKPAPKKPIYIIILKAVGLFVGVFIFVYLFLTFPSQLAKIKYFFSHLGKKEEPSVIEVPAVQTDNGDLLLSSLHSALLTEKPVMPTTTPEVKTTINISDLQNNHLLIPKIDVNAPIIWNSPPDEDVMMDNLRNGVVQYNGTGLPDQPDGNVFIAGHSSYYWWDKGQYKTVFANLDKLDNGDEIALAYNDKVYIYKVFNKIEINPDQTDVLKSTGKPMLSLMTCVPVGTNLRRLIVQADRVTNPNSAQTQQQNQETSTPVPTPTITTVTPFINMDTDIINLLPWRW